MACLDEAGLVRQHDELSPVPGVELGHGAADVGAGDQLLTVPRRVSRGDFVAVAADIGRRSG